MDEKGKKWVDPLEQFLRYHKYVSEYITNFEKFSELSHDPEFIKSPEFDDFLKKYFYEHFNFESKKIFPVLVEKVGGERIRKMVQELQSEHEEMLEKLSNLKNRLKEGDSGGDVFFLAREVLSRLVEHGAKEDDELLPVLNRNRELFEEI